MFVNIKPPSRSMIYETDEQAINHMFIYGVYANSWNQDGQPFGHVIDLHRKINAAIKNRDFSAFTAAKRRGYWRIELKGKG